MARPVIALLKARHPELQVAYTFFSPSAAEFARTVGADFIDYLPFDTSDDADAALDALTPTALVFSKLDVWPVLVARATKRGVRTGMISATLAEGSGRASKLASLLLGDAYRALDAVGAIDLGDAERLTGLGVRRDRVHRTGDTRYDQVWARARGVDRSSALLAPLASERATLVAGSTWPEDESVLFEAWRVVRGRIANARLIIAPHEPTAAHLAAIERLRKFCGQLLGGVVLGILLALLLRGRRERIPLFVTKRGDGGHFALTEEEQVLGLLVLCELDIEQRKARFGHGRGGFAIAARRNEPLGHLIHEPLAARSAVLSRHQRASVELAADRALDALAGDAGAPVAAEFTALRAAGVIAVEVGRGEVLDDV